MEVIIGVQFISIVLMLGVITWYEKRYKSVRDALGDSLKTIRKLFKEIDVLLSSNLKLTKENERLEKEIKDNAATFYSKTIKLETELREAKKVLLEQNERVSKNEVHTN